MSLPASPLFVDQSVDWIFRKNFLFETELLSQHSQSGANDDGIETSPLGADDCDGEVAEGWLVPCCQSRLFQPDELFLSQDKLPHDEVDHPRFHDMSQQRCPTGRFVSERKTWCADSKAGGFIGSEKVKTCNEAWHQKLT